MARTKAKPTKSAQVKKVTKAKPKATVVKRSARTKGQLDFAYRGKPLRPGLANRGKKPSEEDAKRAHDRAHEMLAQNR
tara:strand:+ start:917 stop:1150 length:234 start_codon:yes stop_codon:yes gene_type:complete